MFHHREQIFHLVNGSKEDTTVTEILKQDDDSNESLGMS